jgi:hypothetical protein
MPILHSSRWVGGREPIRTTAKSKVFFSFSCSVSASDGCCLISVEEWSGAGSNWWIVRLGLLHLPFIYPLESDLRILDMHSTKNTLNTYLFIKLLICGKKLRNIRNFSRNDFLFKISLEKKLSFFDSRLLVLRNILRNSWWFANSWKLKKKKFLILHQSPRGYQAQFKILWSWLKLIGCCNFHFIFQLNYLLVIFFISVSRQSPADLFIWSGIITYRLSSEQVAHSLTWREQYQLVKWCRKF